ncbi:YaaL family protein [Clostridium prolinivorans]|uniref:YaaL family protein n=1 Tax=Clostridium prolinivorans TaxID=2769420 RepID=UPI000FD79896|nr:YaaL family protein [Clostridium prolinivorans]
MNRLAIIEYLFKKNTYTEDEKELIKSIEDAKYELEIARQNFDIAFDPQLIDYAIYKENAAKVRLSYLLKQAKDKEIQVDASFMIDEFKAI